jgi:hypothetical protein
MDSTSLSTVLTVEVTPPVSGHEARMVAYGSPHVANTDSRFTTEVDSLVYLGNGAQIGELAA